MKKMIKKYWVFAAPAAVLLTAALITGCLPPLDGNFQDTYTPPAGMGAVRLTINDGGGARSIVPTTIPTITGYTFTFIEDPEGNDTGPNPMPPITKTSGDLTAGKITLVLEPGDYSLEVIGNIASGSIASGMAYVTGGTPGVDTTFSVDIGHPVNLTVALEMLDPVTATGNGTFTYTIGGLGGGGGEVTNLDSATMSITNRLGGTTPTSSDAGTNVYDIKGADGDSGTITLVSGYYDVLFTLTKTSGNTIYHRQVLHIYQYMTSPYTYTFTDSLFPATDEDVEITITNPAVIPDGKLTVTHDNAGLLGGNAATGYTLTLNISDTPADLTISGEGALSGSKWYLTSLGSAIEQDIETLIIEPGTAPFTNPGIYYVQVSANDTIGGPRDQVITVTITP